MPRAASQESASSTGGYVAPDGPKVFAASSNRWRNAPQCYTAAYMYVHVQVCMFMCNVYMYLFHRSTGCKSTHTFLSILYCASRVSFREWQRQQRRLNPLSPPPPPTVSYIYTLLNVIHIKHLNFPGSLGFGYLFMVVSGGHDGAQFHTWLHRSRGGVGLRKSSWTRSL